MLIAVLDSHKPQEGPARAGYFSSHVIEYLGRDHEVFVGDFDRDLVSAADVVWTEWVNEDAVAASHAPCRRLILRMRGYEVWHDLSRVQWRTVYALVYESEFLRGVAEARFPFLKQVRSAVIPSGIGVSAFQFKIRDRGPVAALVARGDPLKGYQLLMEWARRRSDIQLHVTTALPEPRLVRYLEHTAPSNVHVHGTVDTARWLDEIDANFLIQASIWETLGYTAAEAMAMGIKPLIHDHPGARSLWPDEFIWRTFDDLDRLMAAAYDSQRYHDFVVDRLNAEHRSKEFADLVLRDLQPRDYEAEAERQRESRVALYNHASAEIACGSPNAESLVRDFQAKTTAVQGFTEERAWLALGLATRYFEAEDYERATVWAFEALRDGIRADAFCLLGEISMRLPDPEAAVLWYEMASNLRPLPHQMQLRYIAGRHRRALELKSNMRQVAASRTTSLSRGQVLAVMTAPREKLYLPGTLRSLRAAGLLAWRGPRLLVADGCRPDVEGWSVHASDEQCGQAATFFRALRLAVEAPEFESLTLFEDDIILAKNALHYIGALCIPSDLVLVSWFTRSFRRRPVPQYLALIPATNFGGNVAITLPARTVHEILDSGISDRWSERHRGDMVFGEVFQGRPMGIHLPSLVQHIGSDSAVGDGLGRTAPTFVGEDFDALHLF